MEWISVKDRLPAERQSVALLNIHRWENVGGNDWERNVYTTGYLNSWGGTISPYWSIRGEPAQGITAYTHWIPLPEPPKN